MTHYLKTVKFAGVNSSLLKFIKTEEHVPTCVNSPFIHFKNRKKDIYMAQEPICNFVSKAGLCKAELVFGNRVISNKGKFYLTRLIRGHDNLKPITKIDIDYLRNTREFSEWNTLLSLAYTELRCFYCLGVDRGNGSETLTQENIKIDGNDCTLLRGRFAIEGVRAILSCVASYRTAYRPILEPLDL